MSNEGARAERHHQDHLQLASERANELSAVGTPALLMAARAGVQPITGLGMGDGFEGRFRGGCQR